MHVGEVEGKEEEVGGNLFDVGEGAVTDAVLMIESLRAHHPKAYNLKVRGYEIRWTHDIYYDRIQQHTGDCNDIERSSRCCYCSFTGIASTSTDGGE